MREDRGNRWVIVAFALIGLLDAFLPAYTDRKEFWTIDGDIIRWLGVILFATGGALRISPVFVLGRQFKALLERVESKGFLDRSLRLGSNPAHPSAHLVPIFLAFSRLTVSIATIYDLVPD